MADTTLINFGKAVKSARLARKWTLENLAHEALGNSTRKGYCSQVEKGKRNLSESTIRGFARALDLPEATTAPLLNRALPSDDQAEAEDTATERLLADLETLRTQLKLSEALAIALAYKYAEGSPTDIEGALKGLEAAFETAAEQKARDALPSNIDAAVDAVLTEVARLNEEGAVDEADDILEREFEALNEEVERKRAALERIAGRRLAQAQMRGDAAAYARRLRDSYRLQSPSYEAEYAKLGELGQAAFYKGLRFGASFDLETSAQLFDLRVQMAQTPEHRAAAINDKAIPLQTQGTRTEGSAGADLLAQAVAAYDAALEVRTRQDHPVGWAMTQNNKGNALQNQGIRTEGSAGAELLAQAVAAYDAALEVYTRQDHPLDWAMTQNNRGATLRIQSTRTEGPAGADLLAQAVAAYDEALEVHTRQDHPLDWAMTQNNKGNALSQQGIRTEGAAGADLLTQAVAAYDAALEVRTRQDHPLDWAMTQNNRGNALSDQGIRTEGTAGAELMARAAAAYDAALEVYTRQDHPVQWATTQGNLASAKLEISEHDTTHDRQGWLKEALAHVDAALSVYDPIHLSYDHASATRLRDKIQAVLDSLPDPPSRA